MKKKMYYVKLLGEVYISVKVRYMINYSKTVLKFEYTVKRLCFYQTQMQK